MMKERKKDGKKVKRPVISELKYIIIIDKIYKLVFFLNSSNAKHHNLHILELEVRFSLAILTPATQ